MTTCICLALWLALSLAGGLPVAHPHVPKAIVLQGAGGKATLTWFTVPYNERQVGTLAKGSEWHLGFATMSVEMPLAVRETDIPVGRYKLNVMRDEEGEFTAFVLTPMELLVARRAPRGQQPDQSKIDAVSKDLAARGIPERIEFPAGVVGGKHAEHLGFSVMSHGYEAIERGSAEPKAGATFTLMADFGDLHRAVELVERFQVVPGAGKGK